MTAVTYRFVNNAPHDRLSSPARLHVVLIVAAVVLVGGAWLRAQRMTPVTDRVVEIRVYTLKPGVRDDFHRRFIQESLPLLHASQVDVVAYGPSLHDQLSYFLVRSFRDLAERARSEDAFYGSRAWIDGPRAAVMAAIETYSTVVVRMSDDALRRLREEGRRTGRIEGALMSNTHLVQERLSLFAVERIAGQSRSVPCPRCRARRHIRPAGTRCQRARHGRFRARSRANNVPNG